MTLPERPTVVDTNVPSRREATRFREKEGIGMNRSLFVKSVAGCRNGTAVFLVASCLATLAGHSLAADVPLTSAEAAKKVGEKVTVELTIQSAGRNGEFHELHATKDWKTDGCFFLRFSGAARERFAGVNIPEVAVYFLDETVRVTGEVKELNLGGLKKPVIYVENIDQIEVVAAKREFTPTEQYQKKDLAQASRS
jgi:hypothetical protein